MVAESVKSQEKPRKRHQDKNTRQKNIIETGRRQEDTDKGEKYRRRNSKK